MLNHLDQIKNFTTVVADTGDFESIQAYTPQDATTNPSLILQAIQKPQYRYIIDQALTEMAHSPLPKGQLVFAIIDRILILFGSEILKIVPGRVSTEIDANFSFDRDATMAKGKQLISLYEEKGVTRDRVLIKIASTWEGIQAAKELEKEGINCNLTLLFSMAQAIACAEANVKLISPFVGRIYDWYKAKTGEEYQGNSDPGVQSVNQIYNYYKKFGCETQVMGASFRNTGQIISLVGCDLLTISPKLLEELQQDDSTITPQLSLEKASASSLEKKSLNEINFRYEMNNDAMATEKTAEGIRSFSQDTIKLESIIQKLI